MKIKRIVKNHNVTDKTATRRHHKLVEILMVITILISTTTESKISSASKSTIDTSSLGDEIGMDEISSPEIGVAYPAESPADRHLH